MKLIAPLIVLVLASCATKDGSKTPEVRWYRGNLHTHTFWSAFPSLGKLGVRTLQIDQLE